MRLAARDASIGLIECQFFTDIISDNQFWQTQELKRSINFTGLQFHVLPSAYDKMPFPCNDKHTYQNNHFDGLMRKGGNSFANAQVNKHFAFTHCKRVTHSYVNKLNIIKGSDNGLAPDRRKAIARTNDGMVLFEQASVKHPYLQYCTS